MTGEDPAAPAGALLDEDGRRLAAAAIGIVALIMATAYLVGTQHPRVLTCEDFSISGNYAPEDCAPGTGSTVR
jgi:hypothetical protein